MIYLLREKAEGFAVYRILKAIHDWVVDSIEIARVFPIVLGFIAWPMFASVLFIHGCVWQGFVCVLLYATYWLHILLLEED